MRDEEIAAARAAQHRHDRGDAQAIAVGLDRRARRALRPTSRSSARQLPASASSVEPQAQRARLVGSVMSSAKSRGGPPGKPHQATTTPNSTTTQVYHSPE